MKRNIIAFFVCGIVLTALLFTGCQPATGSSDGKEQPTQTVIELGENNYWKYFNISYDMNNLYPGGKGRFAYEIEGVLGFALYEDVVFSFDVFYYIDGQQPEDYQSYTMKIGCNYAGGAKFETTYLGSTNVSVGKWLGADGNLAGFENYRWKIQFNAVSGKVIYTL